MHEMICTFTYHTQPYTNNGHTKAQGESVHGKTPRDKFTWVGLMSQCPSRGSCSSITFFTPTWQHIRQDSATVLTGWSRGLNTQRGRTIKAKDVQGASCHAHLHECFGGYKVRLEGIQFLDFDGFHVLHYHVSINVMVGGIQRVLKLRKLSKEATNVALTISP